jgi:hypothetical protein
MGTACAFLATRARTVETRRDRRLGPGRASRTPSAAPSTAPPRSCALSGTSGRVGPPTMKLSGVLDLPAAHELLADLDGGTGSRAASSPPVLALVASAVESVLRPPLSSASSHALFAARTPRAARSRSRRAVCRRTRSRDPGPQPGVDPSPIAGLRPGNPGIELADQLVLARRPQPLARCARPSITPRLPVRACAARPSAPRCVSRRENPPCP